VFQDRGKGDPEGSCQLADRRRARGDELQDAAAGRVGQRAERPVERHILRHMANHMQRHRAGQLGVSEGAGARSRPQGAWVARLATPVDGVSVVAPTFDCGTESSGEHHHERLALAVDLDGLLQWHHPAWPPGRLGLPPKAAPAEGRPKARLRRWINRAKRIRSAGPHHSPKGGPALEGACEPGTDGWRSRQPVGAKGLPQSKHGHVLNALTCRFAPLAGLEPATLRIRSRPTTVHTVSQRAILAAQVGSAVQLIRPHHTVSRVAE
jgi:hypothetical protein